MLILPESWDESKTNFNGEVDRFKIGAGEGRKNDARKKLGDAFWLQFSSCF